MSENPNPTPRPSFGRALGETARQLTKLHRRALADCGTDFPSWMLLTLLTEQATTITVDQVVVELDRRMDLARPDVIRLLERTADAGHIAHRPEDAADTVALTEAGAARFASIYSHARTVTDAASAGIDADSLDAAVGVLLTVEERAASLLLS
jgi:DNA-binding MarR family transcriptional regulator